MSRLLQIAVWIIVVNLNQVYSQCLFPPPLADKVQARYDPDVFEYFPNDSLRYNQWTDISGNGHHFLSESVGSSPSYIPQIWSEQGALYLNGNSEMTMVTPIEIGAAFVIYSWNGQLPFNDFKGLLVRPTGPGNFRLFMGQDDSYSFWPNGFFGSNFLTNNISTLNIQNDSTFNSTYAHKPTAEEINGLLLGRDFSGGNRYWNGMILELVLFNEQLSSEELHLLKEYRICNYTQLPTIPTEIVSDNFCPVNLNVEKPYFKSYSWSTGSDEPSIDVHQSGSYHVQMITVFNDTLSMDFEVEFPGNYLDDFVLCSGQDSLWQTNLDDFTVTWNDGSQQSDYLITAEGEYWFSVSDSLGCSFSSDTLSIVEDHFAEDVAINFTEPFCSGNPLYLNIFADSIFTYSWSTGSQNPVITPEEEGEYWVEAINNNGCTGVDTVSVSFAGIAPEAEFIYTTPCENAEIVFTDETEPDDGAQITAVQWVFGSDTLYGENVSYNFSESGLFPIQLRVETDAGCAGFLTDTLEVHPAPEVAFSHALPCSDSPTLFEDESTIAAGELAGWHWNFGVGDTADTPIAVAYFDTPGLHNVMLTVTSGAGCSDSLLQQIAVNPSPDAEFDWSPSCQDTPMELHSTTDTSLTGSLNYAWNINGVVASGSDINHVFSGAGEFDVSHEVWTTIDGSPGCFDAQTQTVLVTAVPEVQFDHSPACAGQAFTLTDVTAPAFDDEVVSWQWSASGLPMDTVSAFSWMFSEPGIYPVSLSVVTVSGCVSGTTEDVVVGEGIPPVISHTPEIGLPPLEVAFYNETSYGQSHFWDFGDGGVSEEESPEYTYLDTGQYEVQLFVLDEAGCSGFATTTVEVKAPYFDVAIEEVTVDEQNGLLMVSCIIANYNNHTLRSAVLSMKLGNGTVVSESWSGALERNELEVHTFQSLLNADPEVNDLYVCVTIEQFGFGITDAVPANNEQCVAVTSEPFELFNPFPNPATSLVEQWFYLNQPGEIEVRMINASGQVVMEEKGNYPAGLNQMKLNTATLAQGIYVIAVDWNGNVYRNRILVQNLN